MTVCSMTRFKVKVTSPCLGVCLCVCMSRCVCVYQVVHSRDGEMIYLGTQSVLLQTGLLITRAEFVASPQQPVYITGRVEFFDVSSRASKTVDPHKDEVCSWAVELQTST